MRSKRFITFAVMLAVVLALAVPVAPAHAWDGYIVNICTEGELTWALTFGGTIKFGIDCTIFLSNTIVLNDSTTIDGNGHTVILSGGGTKRVFELSWSIWGGDHSLKNLTIYNGNASEGGGIYVGNQGKTNTLDNVIFVDNHATNGGAIYVMDGASINVSNSNFSTNEASANGGALFIDGVGSASITNSMFVSNNATNKGGGIFIDQYATATVSNSTFSSNNAAIGGGIYIYEAGTAYISSSTFSNNSTSDGGSGIYLYKGAANVHSSTIANNSTPAACGGIFNVLGIVHLGNTIVVNNSSMNCFGTITNGGGNISTDPSCPAAFYGDPMLGPLRNNGGPTFTMALDIGSPAIDKGVLSLCQATSDKDQRGQPRFVDGNRDGAADCDIGAFELAPRWTFLPLLTK